MLFFSICGTFLFAALGSCSIIAPLSIQRQENSVYFPTAQIIFPDNEVELPENLDTAQVISENIKQQLKKQYDYFLGKIQQLENLCESRVNGSAERGFGYQVSTASFNDPRLNLLVKLMTKKIGDLASILADDMEQKLLEMRVKVSKLVADKFSPLTSDISELQHKMAGLATKTSIIQLRSKLSGFITSNVEALKQSLKTWSSKAEFSIKTSHVYQLSNYLQTNVELHKACENTTLLPDVLRITKQTTEEIVVVKENIKNITSTRASHLMKSEAMLLSMNDMEEENTNVIVTLELLTDEIKTNLSSRFFELKQVLDLNHEDCLDGNFISNGASPNVCSTAVAARRCDVDYIAFHCCYSCLNAGLIARPPLGHNGPRNVPLAEALSVIRSNY